ncbi:MAG TPA: class I SAM-dependent methyltransferase [Acidimicrobiales bacterium]
MGEARERRLVFGEDAAGYDAARPSYPAALADTVVALVGAGARAIDVGTGTAKGTRLLAERGLVGVAVEPDPAMAAVAREHLAAHPGWRVDVADFEWWRPEPGDAPADLVSSSQAWHWVHPQVGLWRAHQLLRPGGWLAIWWNFAEPGDDEIEREIAAAYEEHLPGETLFPIIAYEQGSPFDAPVDGVAFEEVSSHLFPWRQRYTTAELRRLLGTHSHHKLLPPEHQERLFDAVCAVVDAHGGVYDFPYVTRLWVGRRG